MDESLLFQGFLKKDRLDLMMERFVQEYFFLFRLRIYLRWNKTEL